MGIVELTRLRGPEKNGFCKERCLTHLPFKFCADFRECC